APVRLALADSFAGRPGRGGLRAVLLGLVDHVSSASCSVGSPPRPGEGRVSVTAGARDGDSGHCQVATHVRGSTTPSALRPARCCSDLATLAERGPYQPSGFSR